MYGSRTVFNALWSEKETNKHFKDNIDYTYNQAEQLSGITRNQTSVSYKYNGDGLMTERSMTKDGQSTTTRYYYDGANIIAEGTVAADGTVTFKARYVRGAQLIYREDANHEKAYYQHNGHGDVTGLVKADGTVLNRYTYDIWGNPLTSDVQVENVFGYSGEYWDEDTGLQYLRSRWYDPSIGRFIQEDTFEGYVNRPSSLNPYTYVENNPLVRIDPSGHDWNRSAGSGGGGARMTPSSPSTGSRSSAPKSRSTSSKSASSKNSSTRIYLNESKIDLFSAKSNPAIRSLRRPIFNEWREKGVTVQQKTYGLNDHAYNRLFKSGRKDILPGDITVALTRKPVPGETGSVVYKNPSSGTKVYVNTTTKEIVGVQPGSFKD
ncbi:RHS repeat-associated core domain-containing protein [Saccharibacillus sp. JS10]|uniref:RHS repeat-associated core domain-containing protein n=1 Tax=Saccharibacillus sp. JS10 TaxID=2950552 RepID=UPI00210CB33C|nr:RHS repeat-associated core domain-containing protein [Saccharibacillus sp. JS10]MCQ4087558.1 RHS repeat-associated core domain-containing protein [Saccharibacillus sp. JS10]